MPSLFDPDSPVGFARVAVERGVDRYPEGLTYAIPPGLADLVVGERVLVPLGRSDAPTAGYVIELCSGADLDRNRIKPIDSRERGAALPPRLRRVLDHHRHAERGLLPVLELLRLRHEDRGPRGCDNH